MQSHVGGKPVEVERAAAVDGNRDFGREAGGQRSSREGAAQVSRKLVGVEDFLRVEPGKRVGQNGNTVCRRDIERGNGICEARSGCGVQSANLDAAACGNFHDSVAMLPRRRA